MMLSRLSPRQKAVVRKAIGGGLTAVALVLFFELGYFSKEVQPLAVTIIFWILLVLNIFSVLAYAAMGSLQLLDLPTLVLSGIFMLANALGYAGLAWLLWPVMQKLKALKNRHAPNT